MEVFTRETHSPIINENPRNVRTNGDPALFRRTELRRETSRGSSGFGVEVEERISELDSQDFFEKSRKREATTCKDDSDYVRDSTETNSSGGSSSTSGYVPTKVRRAHRAIRNKNTGTTELRRNPIRVKKKEAGKSFSRPRQRLLAAKRNAGSVDFDTGRRMKLSTMPYMNTRSVTRKMYNVGATYQAPTIRDETEWKEWPVHGMHERPIFHPQFGLAAEYLGKYFTSPDGLSYREVTRITDRPEIEVVSVDPHCEFLCAMERKHRRTRQMRAGSGKDSRQFCQESKSFEKCMHGSLHCVIGYCSQVMSPGYKVCEEDRPGTAMTIKERKQEVDRGREVVKESLLEVSKASLERNLKKSKENEHPDLGRSSRGKSECFKDSFVEPSKENLRDRYSVSLPQGNKSSEEMEKQRHFPMYITNPQKVIGFAGAKAVQGSRVKSPLILLNTADPKGNVFRNRNAATAVGLNLVKEETQDRGKPEAASSVEGSVTKSLSFKGAKRVNNSEMEKYYFDLQPAERATELKEEESFPRAETSRKEASGSRFCDGKTWSGSETSEIARILSEYNKSNTKKPAIENLKMNAQRFTLKSAVRAEEVSYLQANSIEKNVNIKFLPGKWRRFHFTVEKLKDGKVNAGDNGSEKKLVKGVKQFQRVASTANHVKQEDGVFIDLQKKCPMEEKDWRLEGKEGKGSLDTFGSPVKKDEEACKSLRTVKSEINNEPRTKTLQDLLENTALLYCAAAGVHQDDLAEYINGLDAAQSVQWLETWKNSSI